MNCTVSPEGVRRLFSSKFGLVFHCLLFKIIDILFKMNDLEDTDPLLEINDGYGDDEDKINSATLF